VLLAHLFQHVVEVAREVDVDVLLLILRNRRPTVLRPVADIVPLDEGDVVFGEQFVQPLEDVAFMPALESHERPREAYKQALQLLKGRARPEGFSLATANSMPVLQAIEELGLKGKVHTVTTDLYSELIPMIEVGKVMATIHQRPFTQGKLVFELLLAHLLGDWTQREPSFTNFV
jgi:LacI family transcriptional regulator